MFSQFVKNTVFLVLVTLFSCSGAAKQQKKTAFTPSSNPNPAPIIVGANQTGAYLPLLKGKRVGIVGNQTTVIFKLDGGYIHLVDSLLTLGVHVTTVFAPEHGFRGIADAGEYVKNGVDQKTGLPIISLYGRHKKPTPKDLKNIDILIFDIQDVGLRFYTYISTLHYVMEACAENHIPLLILDRPNPNGSYIDGPIMEKEHESFVGMDPVPVVHGMTIGEYAKMINGQGWLSHHERCKLTVIKMKNYTHQRAYSLPIKPSPNLPNDKAINLYPSLCFFEGTTINCGRGTTYQFQVFGSPNLDKNYFSFRYTPHPNTGSAHPKHEGKLCYGKDLRKAPTQHKINLHWLIEAYQHSTDQTHFFTAYFTKLAGTTKLQQQIKEGMTAKAIHKSWQKGLQKYNAMRQPYLLYPYLKHTFK